MGRRRGTGSIFKQPGCKTWTIKFSARGKTVREATGERGPGGVGNGRRGARRLVAWAPAAPRFRAEAARDRIGG